MKIRKNLSLSASLRKRLRSMWPTLCGKWSLRTTHKTIFQDESVYKTEHFCIGEVIGFVWFQRIFVRSCIVAKKRRQLSVALPVGLWLSVAATYASHQDENMTHVLLWWHIIYLFIFKKTPILNISILVHILYCGDDPRLSCIVRALSHGQEHSTMKYYSRTLPLHVRESSIICKFHL